VLFVVVNQIAYFVVVRLASGGTAGSGEGTGYTVYSYTFLIVMVPHSVVTVSLATAILPRLSACASEGDLPELGRTLGLAMRSALAVVVPFALLLPLVALDLSHVIWGWGAGADSYDLFAPSLALFGGGLVFFTVHYLVLRGFYALEQTRTVFWVQCVIAATNIVAAVLLVGRADARQTAPALVLAYLVSYVVGSVLSFAVLRRGVGDLALPQLARFLARLLLAAAGAAVAAFAVLVLLRDALGEDPTLVLAGLRAAVVGLTDVAVFLLLARVLRLTEVTDVLGTVTRRLPGRRG
jgi:putative peptidoglycan lipid II flippase